MTTAPDGGYTLANTWERARHRLGLLEAVWDPATKQRLERLGVGPGWRCLEVGAGGGSVARWLCERVGPEGRVAAVDLDTRFVSEAPPPNLEVYERDITIEGLPGDGYDLVHTRFVLMHLQGPEQALEAMVAALRPGGRILLEEGDSHSLTHPVSSSFGAIWAECCRVAAAGGADWHWARGLPEAMTAAGLADVGAVSEGRYFRGATPYAELMQLTFEQMTPMLVMAGVKEADVEGAIADLGDPGRWFPGLVTVAGWGSAP